MAVKNDNKDIVDALLNAKEINVNIQDNTGYTPLHFAVYLKNKDIVDALLKIEGINVDIQDYSGNTPLYWARNNKELVDVLLANGAKDNITNTEEQTSTFFDNFFSIITKPFSLIVSFFSGFFSWLFGSNEEKIDESTSQPNASISLLPLDSSSEKKTDAQPSDHSLIVPDQSIGYNEGSDGDGHLL